MNQVIVMLYIQTIQVIDVVSNIHIVVMNETIYEVGIQVVHCVQ